MLKAVEVALLTRLVGNRRRRLAEKKRLRPLLPCQYADAARDVLFAETKMIKPMAKYRQCASSFTSLH